MSHTDFGGVSNSMIPPGMKRILPGLQSDKDSPRMFMNVETLNKSIRSYLYQHTFGAYTSAIFIEVSLCPHFGLVPLGTNHIDIGGSSKKPGFSSSLRIWNL